MCIQYNTIHGDVFSTDAGDWALGWPTCRAVQYTYVACSVVPVAEVACHRDGLGPAWWGGGDCPPS